MLNQFNKIILASIFVLITNLIDLDVEGLININYYDKKIVNNKQHNSDDNQ